MTKFKLITGKENKWLIPENGDLDQIFLLEEGGFNGRLLEFELTNGTTYSFKGPWNSNSDALFNDTGIKL